MSKTGHSAKATLTVTNGAYTASDVVGGLITLAGAVRIPGGTSMVKSIKLGAVAALVYELWFFNADIATPAADNAAFTLVAADEAKFLGHVPIAAADYKTDASTGFNCACVKNIDLVVQAASTTTNIYAYLKTTVTTSPGTNTLYLTVDFEYLN